ncbi:MAG: hypothetical protein ACYCVY_12175 [Acidiferrobacteraceae bacterium]
MFNWLTDPKYSVLANWMVAFGTILSALVALGIATLGNWSREWARRRNDSLLGVAIIETLLEEVRLGLKIMEDTLTRIQTHGTSPVPVTRPALPGASWNDMHTIPDAVLLRIIATSKEATVGHFRINDVRSHCKNYFVHIRESFNGTVYDVFTKGLLADGEGNGDFIGATKNVVALLEKARELLKNNASRRFSQ